MTTTAPHTETEQVSYLGGAARFGGDGGPTEVVTLSMPEGAAAPVHVHDEDETVHVLEGELTFYVGSEARTVRAGDVFVAPRGVPHAYRVESPDGARWQTVTPNGRYGRFIRAVGRPAEGWGLSPRTAELDVDGAVAVTAAAARSGIEILAPPGTLPSDL